MRPVFLEGIRTPCAKVFSQPSAPFPATLPSGSQARGITVAVGSSFTTLDPYQATDLLSRTVAKSFYEGLYSFDKNLKPVPQLAESYEVSEDGLVYTFKLRDGVKFSSGRTMDAEAVKECLDDLVAVHERAAGDLKISNIEADGQTLTITTSEPVPALMNEDDIFTNIRKGDILLHHPYMTFDPVVQFVQQAAKDPDVLAIKQTLYRVSGNSPIIAALAQAAENGKQVSVLVELKARFDEENNIVWAKMLEKAGCHVIYGLLGLKTHSKITLVVRREETGIRRYVHLGTGNYNDSTAKLYTDCGLLTCNAKIGEDATAVFNMLSGYSEPDRWNKLIVAPLWMKDRFLHLIAMEEEHAKKGQKAHIIAKMNSLCDRDIIAALYSASAAGVKIDLIIRGICCLKVGIPGVSENITVRSIVGNFLEHARIFYFYSGGNEEVFMGSADWMPRNLEKRVEIVFPVEDEQIKKEVMHILDIQMKDNVKASILQADGTYTKPDKRGKTLVNSQEYFCREATERAEKPKEQENSRVFVPAEPVE